MLLNTQVYYIDSLTPLRNNYKQGFYWLLDCTN